MIVNSQLRGNYESHILSKNVGEDNYDMKNIIYKNLKCNTYSHKRELSLIYVAMATNLYLFLIHGHVTTLLLYASYHVTHCWKEGDQIYNSKGKHFAHVL